MNKSAKLFFCTILIYFFTNNLFAKTVWNLDKELSEINFELPVLLANKIQGKFEKFEGFVVIDTDNNENNRAFFSVHINSMKLNYKKYRELLLSNIFFDEIRFPISIIDSKKFSIPKVSNFIEMNAELQIKDISQVIPFIIEINYLSNNLVQAKANLEFSRTSYELGKGKWLSTLILRDKILLKVNLFFNRE